MPLLGARIKSLREHRGLEPGQLAYKAGISVGYVYKLESNERPNVSGVILEKIAGALDTTVDYLLGRTNDPIRQPPTVGDTEEAELRLKVEEIAEILSALPPDLQRQLANAIIMQAEAAKAAYRSGQPHDLPHPEESKKAEEDSEES